MLAAILFLAIVVPVPVIAWFTLARTPRRSRK
jgi:hypothetical protein